MLQTKRMDYLDDSVTLEGYCAFNDQGLKKKPAVIVVHDWSGKNEFACKKAEQLAELGYVGFAIDMFGKGIIGKTTEEKQKLIQPLMADRDYLVKRIQAGFSAVKKLENVDTTKIAAIGFCFGGLCVLDLARSGVDLIGGIAFHSLLAPPQNNSKKLIKGKLLIFQGHDDPMTPPDHIAAFQKEMTDANVDWQSHVFGKTQHAFTNPDAHNVEMGLIYNNLAAIRAWKGMENFLEEIFS